MVDVALRPAHPVRGVDVAAAAGAPGAEPSAAGRPGRKKRTETNGEKELASYLKLAKLYFLGFLKSFEN